MAVQQQKPLLLSASLVIHHPSVHPSGHPSVHPSIHPSGHAAASIWFDIWGVVDLGKNKFDFSRQILEKFRFFSGNFTKKLHFLQANFEFFSQFKNNFDFPDKNWLFTAISGQVILFLFKIHHFRTYFLFMIRYNILRPVHDPLRPHDPPAQNLGVATPNPLRIDAYAC